MPQTPQLRDGAHLARAYSLAVAFPDDVPAYVAANTAMVEAEGRDDGFGRFLVGRLRSRALCAPGFDQVYGEALRVASSAGAPELGAQLANDFMKDRTDMLLLARYLEELIGVLPALARGNVNPYRATTLYGAMALVWRSAAGLVMPGWLQNIRQMALDLNEWYVNELMEAVRCDYLQRIWPRTAEFLGTSLRTYEAAKKDGNTVLQLVHSAVILGVATRFAPILGLAPGKLDRLHAGLDVDPLLKWLRKKGWLV